MTEGGAPFLGGTTLARTVTPSISIIDADRSATFSAKLDGASWSGAPIVSEGTHTLLIVAVDCAGNEAAPLIIGFTIDLTAPSFISTNPASGSRVGEIPAALSGTVDTDAKRVELTNAAGVSIETSVTNGSFSFSNAPFAEGENRFTLTAVDAAGQRGRLDYVLTIDLTAPSVEIIEGGRSMTSGAVFRRAVTPEVRSSDPAATIVATLDGAPFTSGTTITTDGAHTLRATATDDLGHQSSPVEVSFTIDTTGPTIAITSPADGVFDRLRRSDGHRQRDRCSVRGRQWLSCDAHEHDVQRCGPGRSGGDAHSSHRTRRGRECGECIRQREPSHRTRDRDHLATGPVPHEPPDDLRRRVRRDAAKRTELSS